MQEGNTSMNQDQTMERIHSLEVAQATQTATQAGAQATQAAMQAGTIAAVAAGSVALIVGIFLGLAIARSGDDD
jgi:CHASE3 domain sensor protein